MKILLIYSTFILIITNNLYTQIRINEVCASNSESLYDEDSDTPDWIELYNYSDEPQNLSTWKISDKPNSENAWQLPDTTLNPKEYLIVHASGKGKFNSNLCITSNGINTTKHGVEDNLSMIYLELEGSNELRVKYNSFYYKVDTLNQFGLAGLIFKDKLDRKSRMVSNLVTHSDLNLVYIQNRLNPNEYRSQSFFPSRLDLEDYEFSIKKNNDSVFAIVYDKYNYPIYRESFFVPNLDKYYIGLTVLSRDINQKLSLNVHSIKLNGREVNQTELKSKAFFDTNIEMKITKNIHLDFKLSKDKDSLFLYKNDILIDSLTFKNLDFDESLCYNEGVYTYTRNLTPGTANSKGYINKSEPKLLNNNFLFQDQFEFSNVSENIVCDTNFKKPFNFHMPLNEKIITSTNLITFQQQDELKAPSTIGHIPLINEKDILFEGLHIFLNTDSFDLFNPHYGLLVADFSSIRADTYCKILNGKQLIFNGNINMTKHGSLSSIGRLQNSVRLYFDDEVESIFGNTLFKNKSKSYGNKVNVRNAGNDTDLYIRDLFAQNISKNLKLEWSDHSPSFVYFNNEFWGLYNLRQRIDNDFLADKYDLDPDDINFLENDLMIKYGTNSQLLKLRNEFYKHNSKTILKMADSIFDLESMIDYLFVETFTLNHDWPYNNVHYWGTMNRKWSFILNDLDFAFRLKGAGPSINNMNSIFSDEKFFIIELFNILVQNDEFKFKFFNRICDLINSDFSTKALVNKLDVIREEYSQLVKYQNEKWNNTVVDWDENIKIIYDFIERRPDYYLEYANKELNEPGISYLNLSTYPINSGTFKVNTITIDTSEWRGRYFQTLPITITAIPNHGMKFVKWNHDSLGTEPTITTTLPELIELEAIFEKINLNEQERSIIINEIMYNADKDQDTKDWIELYNTGSKEVNLKGWSIIDEDTSHTEFVIDEDYLIKPDEYIILTRESAEFEKFINISNRIFGDFDFGIGGNDIIRLIDSEGVTHDSVNYDNDIPWPDNADGTGFTIELINPILDNNIGSNWKVSEFELGSAGRINSSYDSTSSSINSNYTINKLNIVQNNRTINIESKELVDKIELFDLSGNELFRKTNSSLNFNKFTIDLDNYSRGVYFLIVYTDSRINRLKILLK